MTKRLKTLLCFWSSLMSNSFIKTRFLERFLDTLQVISEFCPATQVKSVASIYHGQLVVERPWAYKCRNVFRYVEGNGQRGFARQRRSSGGGQGDHHRITFSRASCASSAGLLVSASMQENEHDDTSSSLQFIQLIRCSTYRRVNHRHIERKNLFMASCATAAEEPRPKRRFFARVR